MSTLFCEFVSSPDTLRVYHGEELIFSSEKGGLTPLLEYLNRPAPRYRGVTVFDRVVGNAAALLLVRAACRRIYSPLGSDPAAGTLTGYGIEHHFGETIPCIRNSSGEDMCPMEKLSLGKTPDEFYRLVLQYRPQ